jgi:hypothetical protein
VNALSPSSSASSGDASMTPFTCGSSMGQQGAVYGGVYVGRNKGYFQPPPRATGVVRYNMHAIISPTPPPTHQGTNTQTRAHLRDVVHEHVFNATLQRNLAGGTAAAGPQHLELNHASVGVKATGWASRVGGGGLQGKGEGDEEGTAYGGDMCAACVLGTPCTLFTGEAKRVEPHSIASPSPTN